jgi:hypothetical protein
VTAYYETALSLLASLNEAHYSLKLHLIYLYTPGLVSIHLILFKLEMQLELTARVCNVMGDCDTEL